MTYIEFFDVVAVENVCTCLTYAPDRVIYICHDSKTSKELVARHISNYQSVFNARGQQIDFTYKTVSKNNLKNAVALLTDIVNEYDDCVFDVTGGEEIYNLALGIIYERYPEKNIKIHKFGIQDNKMFDCDKDGVTVYKDTPRLSVDENIIIYGGRVVYGGIRSGDTYRWNLSDGFANDVERMWDICKENTRRWNAMLGVFAAAVKVGEFSEDGLTLKAGISDVEPRLPQRSIADKINWRIINSLSQDGLIKSFSMSDSEITVSFKNSQIMYCLTLAGRILELKVYMTALSLKEEDGSLVYSDALSGVVIDWDGKLPENPEDNDYDTENEVDVILMHDIVPVFVSCKNGIVTADELYKLNTVAERFGRDYAKKILVSSALGEMGDAAEYIRQRAKDMNIKIVEDVYDDEQFENEIKKFWK